ncbi:MAG: recombinase family protein [Acidobacteria bacterium]|nr:recombinase family protein [Acidobacteriota bacterium]
MSHGYFSYIRVSTQRQGQNGTSLIEQTAAIDRYANTWNLLIIKRFEERETAAKSGRRIFLEMVKALKAGEARGVIIHKIDRSARNLRDWAELGSLIDLGIEIHFVNENIDLSSRGGRLSADIQAVVASDYVRNLREETIKGLRGRIKQGFYPMPAPLGYEDAGAAKAKTIDPVRGPLMRRAFELYASGGHSLVSLAAEMFRLGLRNRNGNKLSKNALHVCLRNPFYIGLIKVRSLSEPYVGQHKPIVSKHLFGLVQLALSGKRITRRVNHFFIFRRLIRCGSCKNLLVAERQKGHVYYRCHTPGCLQCPVKEGQVLDVVTDALKKMQFGDQELKDVKDKASNLVEEQPKIKAAKEEAIRSKRQLIENRLDRLTDAYLDAALDRESYDRKRTLLISERADLEQESLHLNTSSADIPELLNKFLELTNSAYLSFKRGSVEERRELVEIVFSNITVDDRTLIIKLNPPFQLAHDDYSGPNGAPSRDSRRTNSAWISQLIDFFHTGGTVRERADAHSAADLKKEKDRPIALAS